MNVNTQKKIVVIGGGFAGINLIKALKDDPHYHVTLVDRNNYNFFPPLLYQVATGYLEVANISYPFRRLLWHKKNVSFRMGELIRIERDQNKVVLSTGTVEYDFLILATGTESNFFGMENIKKHSLPMKSVSDAIHLRNSILLKAEELSLRKKNLREELGTIVIAGGGPTGVEVAGMIAEMRKHIFDKDYPELKDYHIRIVLVDGSPTLLTPMSPTAQQYALDTLTRMGVEVKLNKLVKDYVDDEVVFADGERIRTRLLIWAAGVTSSVFNGLPKEWYGRGRRLLVDGYNKVIGAENIYALGDTAIMLNVDKAFLEGHPQVAQPAIQQAKNLARNFLAMANGSELKPFEYHDKGSMAIIGRNKAAADLPKPKMHFKGFIAWMMWLFVHLFFLISYRNRLFTMYNWTTSYFTRNQPLRFIIRPQPEDIKEMEEDVAAANAG